MFEPMLFQVQQLIIHTLILNLEVITYLEQLECDEIIVNACEWPKLTKEFAEGVKKVKLSLGSFENLGDFFAEVMPPVHLFAQ